MTEQRTNVLSFRSAVSRQRAVVLTPLLAELDERGALVLRQMLEEIWDQADDRFFAMAGQLPGPDQQDYLDALRTIRMDRDALFTHFLQHAHNSFAILMPGDREASDDAPLFNGTEPRDQTLAIEAMLLKAEKKWSRELWQLSDGLRRVSVDRFTTVRSVPYSPRVLASGLLSMLDGVEITPDAKLILLKLADSHMFSQLDTLYGSMMECLRKAGVRMSEGNKSPEAKRPLPTSRLRDRGKLIASGQLGLASTRGQQGQAEASANRLALIKLLGKMQREQLEACGRGEPPRALAEDSAALRDLLGRRLGDDHRNGNEQNIGKRELDVLGLLGLQFDSVLRDTEFNAEGRDLIACLQVPMVKAALLDRQFFDRNGSPARQLLADAIQLCQSWEPGERAEGMRGFGNMRSLIEALLESFEEDCSVFTRFRSELAEFARPAASRSSRSSSAQSDVVAARTVEQLVEDNLASAAALPQHVSDCIRNAWAAEMKTVLLRHGGDSDQWRRSRAVLEGVCASLRPLNRSGQKEKLLLELPILLEDLRAGLTRQGYAAAQLESLLGDIQQLNMQRLKDAKVTEPESTSGAELKAALDAVLANLRVGDWLSYRENADQEQRCRLAAIINGSGKYIFVDAGGKRIADWRREELAELFANGRLSLIDSNRQFDSLLSELVSDTKDRKDQPL